MDHSFFRVIEISSSSFSKCREESLVDKPILVTEPIANVAESQPDPADSAKPAKKKFVPPEISVPVDVLEATTFFQSTTSGSLP